MTGGDRMQMGVLFDQPKEEPAPKMPPCFFETTTPGPRRSANIHLTGKKLHTEVGAQIAAEFGVASGFAPPQTVVQMGGGQGGLGLARPLPGGQQEQDGIGPAGKTNDQAGLGDARSRTRNEPGDFLNDGFEDGMIRHADPRSLARPRMFLGKKKCW